MMPLNQIINLAKECCIESGLCDSLGFNPRFRRIYRKMENYVEGSMWHR